MQHFLYLYSLADRGVARRPRNDSHSPGYQVMILQFSRRRESVPEKTGKSAFGLLFSPFRDIGRNRHGRADKLAAEGQISRAPCPLGQLVSRQREGERFAPHFELSEIRHLTTMLYDEGSRIIISSPETSSCCRRSNIGLSKRLVLAGSGYQRVLLNGKGREHVAFPIDREMTL